MLNSNVRYVGTISNWTKTSVCLNVNTSFMKTASFPGWNSTTLVPCAGKSKKPILASSQPNLNPQLLEVVAITQKLVQG